MANQKELEPIYDEKVKKVIAGLNQGKNREELAQELGYSSHKSLDVYICRRNFRWDAERGTYLPQSSSSTTSEIDVSSPPTKAALAISLFKNLHDPKDVAKKVGFEDHKDLASFMRRQGYIWSGDLGNYIPESAVEPEMDVVEGPVKGNGEMDEVDDFEIEDCLQNHLLSFSQENLQRLVAHLPLLEYLAERRDSLENLLEEKPDEKWRVPRYTVKGEATTKNVYMSRMMAKMLENFSKENSISQRDIVEGALVEYFRRYGFEHVDSILNGTG